MISIEQIKEAIRDDNILSIECVEALCALADKVEGLELADKRQIEWNQDQEDADEKSDERIAEIEKRLEEMMEWHRGRHVHWTLPKPDLADALSSPDPAPQHKPCEWNAKNAKEAMEKIMHWARTPTMDPGVVATSLHKLGWYVSRMVDQIEALEDREQKRIAGRLLERRYLQRRFKGLEQWREAIDPPTAHDGKPRHGSKCLNCGTIGPHDCCDSPNLEYWSETDDTSPAGLAHLAEVCDDCGEKLETIPHRHTETPDTEQPDHICSDCGHPLTGDEICPKCGNGTETPDEPMCDDCGKRPATADGIFCDDCRPPEQPDAQQESNYCNECGARNYHGNLVWRHKRTCSQYQPPDAQQDKTCPVCGLFNGHMRWCVARPELREDHRKARLWDKQKEAGDVSITQHRLKQLHDAERVAERAWEARDYILGKGDDGE